MNKESKELHLVLEGTLSDAETVRMLRNHMISDLSRCSVPEGAEAMAMVDAAFSATLSENAAIEFNIDTKDQCLFDNTIRLCTQRNIPFLLVITEKGSRTAFAGGDGGPMVMFKKSGNDWMASCEDLLELHMSGNMASLERVVSKLLYPSAERHLDLKDGAFDEMAAILYPTSKFTM